jgi:lipopolysaccharide transport system ATP-binding protein
MSEVAVSAEGLGKAYILPQQRYRHSWKSRLSRHVRQYFGTVAGLGEEDYFWALRDVSFRVPRGKALGIVGKNGSGKSTLLKILSGVTSPSTGRAVLRGRVGSLLEVGTGFHPDLTGRQNIMLSGMLLGMPRDEVTRKFDAIIDFAGIGQFIDVPVKRYSSGMYIRLAYSVASQLETDILILDEVLAVGDAEFQERSRDNVNQLTKSGRTILFVSHSTQLIAAMCEFGIVLDQGHKVHDGTAESAVEHYLKMVYGVEGISASNVNLPTYVDLRSAERLYDSPPVIAAASVHRLDGTPCSNFHTGDGMRIRIEYDMPWTEEPFGFMAALFVDLRGQRVMTLHSTHAGKPLRIGGRGVVECLIPELQLVGGEYSVMLDYGSYLPDTPVATIDCVPNALRISVTLGEYVKGVGVHSELGQGVFAQRSSWTVMQRAPVALVAE